MIKHMMGNINDIIMYCCSAQKNDNKIFFSFLNVKIPINSEAIQLSQRSNESQIIEI